jgi:predicted neutral ceramidase superfamily lipid hydrolase
MDQLHFYGIGAVSIICAIATILSCRLLVIWDSLYCDSLLYLL